VDLRVTDQATRSLVRVLGVPEAQPGAWLTTTTFYDEKLRPIQVVSTNARGGTDVTSTRYDFIGQALSSYTTHKVPNQSALAVQQQTSYDHAGRVLQTEQTLAGGTREVLAKHTYNELGQLQQKVLGAQLQTVDYRYNVRGWLTHVNDPDNPDPTDLWSLQLHYDKGFNENQFNGNIAGQTWRSRADGIERAYGYRYDALNRLLQGDFVARTQTGPTTSVQPWSLERSNYRLWATSYDAAGNIQTLRRRGLVAAGTSKVPAQYAETDNLRYAYQPATQSEPISNRLQRVDDLAPAPSAFGTKLPQRPDFSDGPTKGATTPDYTYDAAGSLLSDKNKQITSITYNYLHLPTRLEWADGNALEYRYTAAGQKVTKLAYTAGQAQPVRTDYISAWQYERDTLRWLSNSEGRMLRLYSRDAAGQVTTKTAYEYTLKDHLSNLRIAFRPGEKKTYWALLDSNPELVRREQQQFDSASVSAPIRTYVGNQFARSGDGVARLSAGGLRPTPLGPLKQLPVAQGDTVTVTAYGMYPQAVRNANWAFSLASFVASLVQQQPAAPMPLGDGSTRRVRVLPLLSVGLGIIPAVQQLAGGVPKAYLRVFVYNADSALVDSRTVQLTSAAHNSYQALSARVIIPRQGYVQAFVANESEEEVYFDDISVEHRQGLQVQETEYDPYGLELAGMSRAGTPENKYTFNGKERQDEFGLRWHDHGWRFYDPSLGRWVVSDPDAEEGDQESWGTYQFGMDNAVRYNDLDGRFPIAAVLIGAAVGAGVEYGVQVATNLVESRGQISKETFTGNNVSVNKLLLAGAAGGAGALTGAVFGQAATGFTRIASASRLANSSKTAAKALNATIKLGGELSGDVASSVIGNKIQGKEVTVAGTITDVAGGVVSRKVQLARQMTPSGQVLRREAGRTANIAAQRGRANATKAATNAADRLARKGAVSSGLASGATTNAISTAAELKEKIKKLKVSP